MSFDNQLYEKSVVPGEYREKTAQVLSTEQFDITDRYRDLILSGMKDGILNIKQAMKKKHREQRYAKIKFKQIKETLEHDKLFQRHQAWSNQKMYQKKLKSHVNALVHEYQQASVARKKDIEETFTQKCVVEKSKPGPSEHEQTIMLLGSSDMLPIKLRENCKNILQKELGIVKPQTQQDKNHKAFDKYMLS